MGVGGDDESSSSTRKRESGPFSGLVICVTGVSKEGRKQVKEGSEQLGGIYSPNLNPNCTHLIIHISSPHTFPSHKLKHALTHFIPNGLHLVTLGWFLHSLHSNARLSESPYSILDSGAVAGVGLPIGDYPPFSHSASTLEHKQSRLSARSLYIDPNVSLDLRNKVLDVVALEGAVTINQWFAGCGADYVVCEASMIHKYIRHSLNIVSPIWILKTFQDTSVELFVGLSADLARDVGFMLENATLQQGAYKENCLEHNFNCETQAERVKMVKLAKCGIRNRRTRRIQSCQIPLRPINPSSLLDSICWSISEPTSTASVYVDPIVSRSDCDIHKDMILDEEERVEFVEPVSNSLRPLTESEENELVFRNHFLTILYPVDRFAEMGPSSRTYFSDMGFTCVQLLGFIYDFYQENMSDREIEVAIHADSRHAEQLRSIYCREKTHICQVMYKRILLLGSRKSFELLKRVSGDNNNNVYELLIRE